MDDLKSLIRSILISSPLQMQIWKLDKDYEEINGESIPYETFGFRSLEDLLRNIPDIVEVHGFGRNAVLKVFVSSKTAHIDKLISKQRLPEPRRRARNRPRPPRRSTAPCRPPALFPNPHYPTIYSSYPMPYHLQSYTPMPMQYMQAQRQNVPPQRLPFQGNAVPPRFNPPVKQNVPSPAGCNLYYAPVKCDVPPRHNQIEASNKPLPPVSSSPLPVKNSSSSSPLPKTPELPISKDQPPQLSPIEKKSPTITNSVESNIPSTPSSWQWKLNEQSNNGAIPKQNTNSPPVISPDKAECYYSSSDCAFSDEDYVEECQPEDEYINYNVPFAVQENLKKLIGQHGEGIWCAEMPNIYLKMFKKPLDYSEYGYRSLIQMCMSLEKIFHCHRPDNGDFLLFDKTKPVPRDLLKSLQYISSFKAKLDQTVEEAAGPAIIEAEELAKITAVDYYPTGVMQLGEEIPRQFLPDNVMENDFVDVVVGEVYDPSKFWILLKEHSEKLDMLMDEMQTFYTSFEGNLEIPNHMMKIGLYCAARYNHEYHRAIIVNSAFETTKIKVFYGDYGTLATINRKGLLFLHRKFMNLPLQAIRARLASIWPPVACSPWSLEASSRLLSLVTNKVLVAHIFRIIRDKQIVEMFLADTTTPEDIYMNDELVKEGLALFTNKEQEKKTPHPRRIPKFKHMHFFPTFEDLEWGNAPSAAEIIRLCKIGFQEEYLFPNYYIEVINEDSKLNDDEFLESQKKLLFETEKLKNDSTADVTANTSSNDPVIPCPNWTELCKEEEDQIANANGAQAELSMSDEPITSPESPFTPNRQIFATTDVKPPPGFEGVKPNCPFNIIAGQAQESTRADSLTLLANRANVTTMLPAPILVTNQPVNFVTQQVVDPTLFMQNSKQNELLQQLALSRMLNFQTPQTNVPSTAWYQNMLINQQNSLLLAQQQNPLMFQQQQNPLLFNQQQTPWNHPNQLFQQQNSYTKHQLPGSHCVVAEQRQQLQNFVHKHLMKGDRDLLTHLGNMLRSQSDQKEGLLFRLVCEILLNGSTMVSYRELELIVTNLLDSLVDCQIIDLAMRQLESTTQENNVATQMDDVLVELISRTSINSQTPSNSSQNTNNRVRSDKDAEVQTDVELEINTSRTRLVIRTDLENLPVHVIRFKHHLYVPVNDILQFTITKPSIDVIRKMVVMTDPTSSIIDIRLNEHKELAEELSSYKICDPTIHVISVLSIPNMTKILGSKESLFSNYNDFLKTINVNSDLWLRS